MTYQRPERGPAINKVAFISSTYQDLIAHRRSVWNVLEGFEVTVRGMEQFGARPEGPLETCLAEVAQSDVYVGIVAFRNGSVDADSGKSYTQLEYDRAYSLGKEILIYLAEEGSAQIPYSDIDRVAEDREPLNAFKRLLRERHTVETFTTPEDLSEKLQRDFVRYFTPSEPEATGAEAELDLASGIMKRFLLLPKTVSGREVRLRVAFGGPPYAAARAACTTFRLDYGAAVGIPIQVAAPSFHGVKQLNALLASGKSVDELLTAVPKKADTTIDLYARLMFSADDIGRTQARFFSTSFYVGGYMGDSDIVYESAEGKLALVFTKIAY